MYFFWANYLREIKNWLETKDELRRRGVRSPDYADALALTFAEPVESEPNQKDKEEMLREEWTNSGEYDYMTG